jgi:hypothetical protein
MVELPRSHIFCQYLPASNPTISVMSFEPSREYQADAAAACRSCTMSVLQLPSLVMGPGLDPVSRPLLALGTSGPDLTLVKSSAPSGRQRSEDDRNSL